MRIYPLGDFGIFSGCDDAIEGNVPGNFLQVENFKCIENAGKLFF